MGKASARPSRRNRQRKSRAKAEVRADGLKIVILTSPKTGADGVTVAEDVRLVRSALLYADAVELISPGAQIVGLMAAGATQGEDFLFDLMLSFDDEALRFLGYDRDPEELRKVMAALKASSQLPRTQRRKVFGVEGSRQLRGLVQEFADRGLHGEEGLEAVAAKQWEKAGAPDLAIAAESGLFTLNTEIFDWAVDTDRQIDQYVKAIRDLIADPTAHLMFDEAMGTLARHLVEETDAEMHPLAARHAKQALTGTGLIAHLPAFPDSAMEQIIATRKDLLDPLSRYRRGMAALSAKLTSGPLDSALRVEVDDMWRDEVQPTVADLRRELSTTRLLADAFLNVTNLNSVTAGIGGAIITFGVDSLADLSNVASAGFTAAVSATGVAGVTAIRGHYEARQRVQTHDLYYLLEADRRLR